MSVGRLREGVRFIAMGHNTIRGASRRKRTECRTYCQEEVPVNIMENDMQHLRENTVFVGNKPVMNYVLAVVTQFNNGAETVAIKARGKAISRAVDTAEISLNRFLEGVTKKDIVISTEMIDTDSGKTNVSSIEIVLENHK